MDRNVCFIYFTNEADSKSFCDELSAHLNLKMISHSFWETDIFDVSIISSHDFNANMQSQFPDGFLHFKFILEVLFKEEELNSKQIEFLDGILKWLWGKNIPAIAACAYEDRLAHNGGYKDKSLPWPQ